MSNFIKRPIRIALAVLLVLGLVAAWFYYNLPEFLVDDFINLAVNRNQSANLFEEDGLYVITTGTGAPLPDEGRADLF